MFRLICKPSFYPASTVPHCNSHYPPEKFCTFSSVNRKLRAWREAIRYGCGPHTWRSDPPAPNDTCTHNTRDSSLLLAHASEFVRRRQCSVLGGGESAPHTRDNNVAHAWRDPTTPIGIVHFHTLNSAVHRWASAFSDNNSTGGLKLSICKPIPNPYQKMLGTFLWVAPI